MNVGGDNSDGLAELRKNAEARMRSRESRLQDLSDIEVKQLVFELGTHQIELEMQNEELRRSQLLVAESRDRYTELYDFAPVGYLTIDDNARILQANLTVAELLHIEREKLLGQFLLRLAHPDDADELFLAIRKDVATHERNSIEVRLATEGNDEIYARLDIGAFKSEGGNNARRLVAISDITEIKRAEAERRELQEQLEQSQRLESLGVLAGGIAHDFNNLLTGISLNNSIIANSLGDESQRRNSSDQIDFAVQQATALCEQMLVYAGKGEFDQTLLDVSKVLEDTSKLLRSSVNKNISFEMRLSQDLPPVLGDRAQLRQVAINLVMNASEAIEEQGHVSVASRMTRASDPVFADPTAMSNPLLPGEYVCLEVTDNGCGLLPSDIPRIFEPFYTTKFTGRGLGMSVVVGIVRRHKGAIAVESREGHGTTIRVLLPIAESGALENNAGLGNEVTGREKELESEDARSLGTILVVDDEPLVRRGMQSLLEANGFSVMLADCGQQAIEVLRENVDVVSLVLLDLTMPGLPFAATLSGLRQTCPDIPVVLMSGHSDSDVSSMLAEKNIVTFIRKPMESPVKVIQRVLCS